jgi:hypothetical protein
MSYIQSAINCFEENLRLFGDPQTDSEKYNLYNGLTGTARAIQYIDREVSEIKLAVDRIIRNR